MNENNLQSAGPVTSEVAKRFPITAITDKPNHGQSTCHEWITPEQAKETLKFCDSYNRLPKLLEIQPLMESYEWLEILGGHWSSCDNISGYISELLSSPMGWGIDSSIDMMNWDERDQLEALPDV